MMKSIKNIFSKASHDKDMSDEAGKHGHSQNHTGDVPSTKGYYCPMKCEGDKVYDSPGRCPVCNMKLIPVKE